MGSRLCTFLEYCPDGPYGDLWNNWNVENWHSDAYAPYYSLNTTNENEWLQVGYWQVDEPWQGLPFFNNSCWINPWNWDTGYQSEPHHMKPGACCFGQNRPLSTTPEPTTTTTAPTAPPNTPCGEECLDRDTHTS